MNVQVVMHGERVSFKDFCERHGITITVRERSLQMIKDGYPRWYVSVQPMVEIRKGGFLTTVGGNGETPDAAVREYARRLLGHRLLIGGYDGNEAIAPNEWVWTL